MYYLSIVMSQAVDEFANVFEIIIRIFKWIWNGLARFVPITFKKVVGDLNNVCKIVLCGSMSLRRGLSVCGVLPFWNGCVIMTQKLGVPKVTQFFQFFRTMHVLQTPKLDIISKLWDSLRRWRITFKLFIKI